MSTPAFVITISDRCARGIQSDESGPAVRALLEAHNFPVTAALILPDEQPLIEQALREAARTHRLVITTGGTGLTPRDVTPEATARVCTRLLDGLAQHMRTEGLRETPYALLSRGLCGTLGQSLILNLPGAPRGAQTSLRAVLPILPHALDLLLHPSAQHPNPFSPDTNSPVEIPKR